MSMHMIQGVRAPVKKRKAVKINMAKQRSIGVDITKT